jgi:hypothetical protein
MLAPSPANRRERRGNSLGAVLGMTHILYKSWQKCIRYRPLLGPGWRRPPLAPTNHPPQAVIPAHAGIQARTSPRNHRPIDAMSITNRYFTSLRSIRS